MVGSWRLYYTAQAQKDAKKLKYAGLKEKAEKILKTLEQNPFEPPYEKLTGDFEGAYSRRINIQHRVVYQVLKKQRAVKVIRLYTHYE
ncbi:MAG TPA: Txe/YoeB family addiction module toxin [bacterium]|nr:Txe/YoeB family addiction module toxin [bacterium]